MDRKQLISRIKKSCENASVSISELEQKIGVSQGYISRLTKTVPSSDKVRNIADILNVSVDYLLGRTDIPDTADQIIRTKQLSTLQRYQQQMNGLDDGDREELELLTETFIRSRIKRKQQEEK